MDEHELYQRSLIALIFLWGFITKLLLMGYQVDKNDPDRALTINRWLWYNSQKWRVVGSFWFLIGIAFIAPHEGFVKLQEYVFYDVPVGHLGTGAVGFLGDDIFVSLDGLREYIKNKLSKTKKEGNDNA